MAGWIWVLIGVIAFFGALLVLMMRPAKIDIQITGGQLLVRLLGFDKIWCVRGQVAVPIDQVVRIEALDRTQLPRPGIRLPGSYLPGIITAGSYGLGENRTFWDARKASKLLVVRCGPEAPYRRLVLEVPQPEEVAARLRAQLK